MENNLVLGRDGSFKKSSQKKKKTPKGLQELKKSFENRDNFSGVLTGKVTAVESNDKYAYAVVYVGDFKVLIPEEFFLAPEHRNTGNTTRENVKPYEKKKDYALKKRLGSVIDFVIDNENIDEKSRLAIGNRLKAMEIVKNKFFFDQGENGEYTITDGTRVEARIVCTNKSNAYLEIFGIDKDILVRDLAWTHVPDVAAPDSGFKVGETVDCLIKTVERGDDGSINITISVKEAHENPAIAEVQKLEINGNYIGTIKSISAQAPNNVFVRLETPRVDVMCKYPDKFDNVLVGNLVTVRITDINMDKGQAKGRIIH